MVNVLFGGRFTKRYRQLFRSQMESRRSAWAS
jgi:hypothetical protein